MATNLTRISQLDQVNPQLTDQILISRGSGSVGQSLRVTVDGLKNLFKQEYSNTFNVQDTNTIDLDWNPTTNELEFI